MRSQTELMRSHASRMSSDASRTKISLGSSSSASTSRSWSSYQSPSAIAFWKMVGLEVTPTMASSSIMRASSPVRSHSRESESIQTLWPRSLSWWSRDLDTENLSFHRLDLLEPSAVALASVELRSEECRHELRHEVVADDSGADAEHVHIVVLYTLPGGLGVVADRRSDAGELAGRNGRADTGAADENPALRLTPADRLADLPRLVGVVHMGLRLVGPEVHELVTEALHVGEDPLPEFDPAMVERDRNLHTSTTLLLHVQSGSVARARPAAAGGRRARERQGRVGASDLVDVGCRSRGRAPRRALPLRLRRSEEPGERPARVLEGPRLAARLRPLPSRWRAAGGGVHDVPAVRQPARGPPNAGAPLGRRRDRLTRPGASDRRRDGARRQAAHAAAVPRLGDLRRQ